LFYFCQVTNKKTIKMTNNSSPLERLKSFLNELFQFETQDLDFGVYKILNYKRKEIKQFIDELLVTKVREQLQTFSDIHANEINKQLEELEEDEIIQGWNKADEEEKKTLKKYSQDKINKYIDLKEKSKALEVSEETENHIYNHIAQFFSRYYDKGDFISKRRFGKNEKYVVPYNGEETHFYWANHDQYYIKSSENFQKYAFKIKKRSGMLVVNFKLTEAQTEQGNVKSDENKFFVLSQKEAEINDSEANFFFEYRPLTDDEKQNIKGNNKQDVLNQQAVDKIKEQHKSNFDLAALWEEVPSGKNDELIPFLLKKLNHYTRKNNYDFFIHNDLKSFLQRELDYYIKTEWINVDDLYIKETETYQKQLQHHLKAIKVFKQISETLIDFISQIEDFQKKLWEKKKFVLNTHWVITIDRLVEYIDEEAAKPFLEEVIKNEKQIEEWKDLFGTENIPKKLSVDLLKADLHSWKKLPIDTMHFSKKFKEEILRALSEKIDLEEKADGLVMNSDNFHGLELLSELKSNIVDFVYIDPPYNTGSDEFNYKDNYKDSSWLSFINNRIELQNKLLKNTGCFFSSINEEELFNYKHLIDEHLGIYNYITTFTVKLRHDERILKGDKSIHEVTEFCYMYRKNPLFNIGKREIENTSITDYVYEVRELIDEPTILNLGGKTVYHFNPGEYQLIKHTTPSEEFLKKINIRGSIREGNSSGRFYVSYIEQFFNNKGHLYKVMNMGADNLGYRYFLIPSDIKRTNADYFQGIPENNVSIKFIPYSNFIDMEPIFNKVGDEGGVQFRNGKKPISFIQHLFTISGLEKNKNAIVLDYFGGSGSTFHALLTFNKKDHGKRKCYIIEQDQYCKTKLIPRLKKIANTLKWKAEKPINNMNDGTGIFFKYQRLEQYEEALENIYFNASEETIQKSMEFDDYMPKYFLEFETRGSQTFVNTSAMQNPYDYKLKVWDGFNYDTEQAADLVETYNYLIGLHLKKQITKEINNNKYCFVFGNNNDGKHILVVWRNTKDWSKNDYEKDREILKKELENYTYDLLYINNQAHIQGYQPIEEVFKNKMMV